MNHSIRKATLLAAVGLPAVLAAQGASAALITTWDYEIDSTFANFTENAGEGSVVGSGGNAVLGGDTTLSWSDDLALVDRSSVSIDSDVDGSGLETNQPGVAGATFTHNNQIIPGDSATLDTFMLQTRLDLTATAPPETLPAGQIVGPITFNSFFTETPNAEPCTGGNTPPCDDIFVLSNAGELGVIGQGQSFVIDDYQYTVFLDVSGLGPLTNAQCGAAGADDGCIGFLTQEEAVNNFASSVRITAREVPAPGVLALLGAGLLGLGFMRRGRQG